MVPQNTPGVIAPLLVLADLSNVAIAALDVVPHYNTCKTLLNSLEFEEKPLRLFFEELCANDLTPARLQEKFSPGEIRKVNAILEWYSLILSGYLPASGGYDRNNVQELGRFLGCSGALELLSPSSKIGSSSNILSFSDVLDLVSAPASSSPDNYSLFLRTIQEHFKTNASVDMITTNINLYISSEISIEIKKSLLKMDAKDLLRWALFMAVIAEYHNHREFVEELTYQVGNKMPSDIPNDMQNQLWRLGIALLEEFKKENSPIASCHKVKSFRPVLTYAKMDITGLPNWMPNGGNTCYISSTLWGLFLLLDEKIQEKLASFDSTAANCSPQEKRARDLFKALYSNIAANENIPITVAEVNAFRSVMQEVFPGRFMSPGMPVQEDAYDFLAATFRDLLGLDCTENGLNKFLVLHTFDKVGEEPLKDPELYNYTAALAKSYNPQPSYGLDIRLDEQMESKPGLPHKSLRDLLTVQRQTDIVERNAYLYEPNPELAKYQSVNTRHTEQFMVESAELAPEFFCARLVRFTVNYETGQPLKRFDIVYPNAYLEFPTKQDPSQTVAYDLVASCVHSGPTINAGHYYTYFRHVDNGVLKTFRYDDINGPELCVNEQKVLHDIAKNGYVFYYKKRPADAQAPVEFFVDESYLQPTAIRPPAYSQDSAFIHAEEYVASRLLGKFAVDKEVGCYPSVQDKAKEKALFDELVGQLKKAVYLIDPDDIDLEIMDEGYPIPGDSLRFGEIHSLNGVQYVFKQANGTYVSLYECKAV